MPKTYTYTARGADDPARAITFTLHDHHLTAEFALPPDEIDQRLKAAIGQAETSAAQSADTNQWIASVAEPLRQHGDEPFALDDIDASTDGDALRVTAWSHADDQRLQPIVIALDHVDNPQAAAAFADEVNHRKLVSARRAHLMQAIGGRVFWFTAGAVVAVGVMVWLRKKSSARFELKLPQLGRKRQRFDRRAQEQVKQLAHQLALQRQKFDVRAQRPAKQLARQLARQLNERSRSLRYGAVDIPLIIERIKS
jgi:hypothetical protein